MDLTGVAGTLKNAIGKPRPDLVDRCQPAKELMDQFLQPGNFSLASHAICTQKDNAILKDGFRSFPSGHSSSMFQPPMALNLQLTICRRLGRLVLSLLVFERENASPGFQR